MIRTLILLKERICCYPPRLQMGLAAGLVIIVGILCFMAGARYFNSAMVEKRLQKWELHSTREELMSLQQEKVNLELDNTVNEAALEQIRERMVSLQQQLARQGEELGLYRTLMAEQGDTDALSVDSLNLRPTAEANTYQYRMVVRGRPELSKAIDASISLTIEGLLAGEPHTIPFNEADLSLQGEGLAIRFKYFKVLRGEFVLPAGFVPHKVVLSVLEKGNASSLRFTEFPWRVEGNSPSSSTSG